MANLTGHADRIGEPGAVIRHGRDGLEMVNLVWGLAPAEAGGRPFEVVRSEGRTFPDRRCLAPASEFFVKRRGRRYRVTLASGDWFYLAGIWRAATSSWAAAYAVLTVNANEDLQPYAERQMAVILRDRRMDWLDAKTPESDVLTALPLGALRFELHDEASGVQPQLSL